MAAINMAGAVASSTCLHTNIDASGRPEVVNRSRFWRYLTGDDTYDTAYWLTRLENSPSPLYHG